MKPFLIKMGSFTVRETVFLVVRTAAEPEVRLQVIMAVGGGHVDGGNTCLPESPQWDRRWPFVRMAAVFVLKVESSAH